MIMTVMMIIINILIILLIITIQHNSGCFGSQGVGFPGAAAVPSQPARSESQ